MRKYITFVTGECLKVIVVGASPAGSSTAESILKENQNNQVTILERKAVLGEDPRCAGGVQVLRFRELNIPVPEYVVAARVRRCRIYGPSADYWEIDAKKLGLDCLGYVFHRDRV
jgi:flavin-dependent dehydrogenase